MKLISLNPKRIDDAQHNAQSHSYFHSGGGTRRSTAQRTSYYFYCYKLLSVAAVSLTFLAGYMIANVENYSMYLPYRFFPDNSRILVENSFEHLEIEKQLGTPQGTTFLLGIFTMESEQEEKRRQLIRDTYLSNDFGGRTCTLKEFKKQVTERADKPRTCEIPYVFVISGGNESRPTEHNDNEPLVIDHSFINNPVQDAVYLNIKENMENGKSVSFFKYAASLAGEYGIHYISKIDSDTLLSVNKLLDLIDFDLPPSPHNKRMYGGYSWGNLAGNSVYAAGQFYFMSLDLAHYIGFSLDAEQRKFLTDRRRPTEDLDIGSFVFSHPKPIKFIDLNPFQFWYHPVKVEEEWMNKWRLGVDNISFHAEVLPFWHMCPHWKKIGGLK